MLLKRSGIIKQSYGGEGWATRKILHVLGDVFSHVHTFTVPTDIIRAPSQLIIITKISGNYSCLLAELYLKRSLGFHMVQSYIPTILIVVISWVSFWMDVDSVAGRTTLGVTTLLAVSSKSSGMVWMWSETPLKFDLNLKYQIADVQAEVPLVSYVKVNEVIMCKPVRNSMLVI